ncbi:MAG: response regulator [Planctomycetes bacterium]|nr:response regulator [Planctomycetota bacterium]
MSKILIVEDDKNILKALVIRLRARGYELATAQDVQSALDVAAAEPPDLVLMDISLPSGNGFEVLRALRAEPALRDVQTVFVTASRRPGLRERANELGAAGFFEKPFEATELLDCIDAALRSATVHEPAPRGNESR